jgi:cytochrome c-type biogenesis protein CcmE
MSRERKRRRLLAVVTLLIAGGVLAYLAFGGIGENLVYYWSPTELREAGPRAFGATVRLGGLVEEGSVERQPDGLTMRFAVTDGKESVPVIAETVPPAMFREGIGVVVEGTMVRAGHFETTRLMVKHDNEYRAPEDYNDKEMKELMKSLQFEETGV